MSRLPEKLLSLAATARISNVPGVAANGFLGLALAQSSGHPITSASLLTVFAGIGLYLAGNFANDWADRDWDAIHRPERALPRGLFAPRTFLAAAAGLGLLGLCTAAAAGLRPLAVALAIGVSILIYTRTHKRTACSVIPMGLCRALLPLLGFTGLAAAGGLPPALAAGSIGVFLHIVGLSLSARNEAGHPFSASPLRLAPALFPAAALMMLLASMLGLSLPPTICLIGTLPYLLWITLCLTRFRKPAHAHVSNLLAGIPLLDWIILLPLAFSTTAPGPFPSACMILPPLAFLAGKALQRLAPAT